MDNIFIINPAAAGMYGYTDINLLARQQWVGFDLAPRTFSFSVEGRVLKHKFRLRKGFQIFNKNKTAAKTYVSKANGKVGLGFQVFDDRSGLIERTGLSLAYAYHFFIRETQVSLGLSLSATEVRFNKNAAIVNDQADPIYMMSNRYNIFLPDANAGCYFLNNLYHAGISAQQIFQTSLQSSQDYKYDYHFQRYFYANGGLFFYRNDYIFEPSFLFKTSESLNYQCDLSFKTTYRRQFWMAISYRTNNDIIFIIGCHVKNLYIGYSVDYSMTSISALSYELSVSMRLGSSEKRYRWMERY